MTASLSVRPMSLDEARLIPEYFHAMTEDQLRGIGVDPPKLPSIDDWNAILAEDFANAIPSKQFFYVAWLVDGELSGYSNINKIQFGDHAFAHLHLWKPDLRQQGLGTQLFRLSLKLYFETFELQSVFCEPFAENPAPNRTLPRAGFKLMKTYETTPGWINMHQTVNRWRIQREEV